ncbi:NUDIX domain-containing protein [Rhodococcus sp. NPDC056743]|uniref:NUDIX hydrolase n=1 Tax=Rhodococcus sp. NPDC056743 TaxID=3345934 RepID=UPI00366EA843
MRGDGDGWSVGSDGTRHWGRHGAAGLLLRAPDIDGTPMVLLQHRAAWSHQGGTWALPGGARDSHESTTHAAVREAHEEAGIDSAAVRVRGDVVTMRADSGWTYTTVVADVESPLETVANGESTELRWVREDDVESLPLHPGFHSAWPSLRTSVVTSDAETDGGGARTVVLPGGGFGWTPGDADSVQSGSTQDRSGSSRAQA